MKAFATIVDIGATINYVDLQVSVNYVAMLAASVRVDPSNLFITGPSSSILNTSVLNAFTLNN